MPTAWLEQLRALGLPAASIAIVHTSFKAVGSEQGGPRELIDALRAVLGPDGTLVMPAMSDDDDVPFDPRAASCRANMGVVADTFWRLPGVLRSDNPASFAAIGPLAPAFVAPHPIEPPHGIDSPVGRVAALGGFVLLLGVDHSANTTIHLAESMARVPYRARKYCTVLEGGQPVRVDYDETDHCCQNFNRIDGELRRRALQREGRVGHAIARLARSTDVVHAAITALQKDPCAFLHPRGAGCEECDSAWASIPVP
ncbi:AAC(3) family N-acetyltransferase [Pendulispora albinea]|uniref:Aminoglycoside N(3)-acetyltransferase n=1 Tax=Pendulispora albinea TaxID=2741071 RepID=A0ABZ2M0V6_9BACT